MFLLRGLLCLVLRHGDKFYAEMENKLFPTVLHPHSSVGKTDHIVGQSTLSPITCFKPIQKTPSLHRDFQQVVSLMFCPRQKFQRFHFATNLLFHCCNVFFGIILTKLHLYLQEYFVWLEKSSSANIAFIDFSQGLFVLSFLNQSSLHKQNISHTTYFHYSKPAPISFPPLPVADSSDLKV